VEEADVIVLWGSNAREAHPIFFHHVLKAIHRGAKLFVVDPRRTASAAWADRWRGTAIPAGCGSRRLKRHFEWLARRAQPR
jgi:predicted molibdopterin-dependent oxidoreductase YjgC